MARLLIYVALPSLLQACDHGGPEGPGCGSFTSVALGSDHSPMPPSEDNWVLLLTKE